MKCLTLTQPWATLVAIGAKRIETRSWRTSYRGPLAIHAAKGFPKSAQETCWRDPFDEVLRAAFGDGTWAQIKPKSLPQGCVIATCTLWDCVPTRIVGLIENVSDQERAFGDYSNNRWAWILRDIKPLPETDPCKGAQSLWQWDSVAYWARREGFGPNGDATTPGFVKRVTI